MQNHLHVNIQEDPDMLIKFSKKTYNLLLISSKGYDQNKFNDLDDIDYTQIFFEVDTNANVRVNFSGNCILPMLIRYNDQINIPFDISNEGQTAKIYADTTGVKALNELHYERSVKVMNVDDENYSLGYLKTQELIGVKGGFNGAILCLGFNPRHTRQYTVQIELIYNEEQKEDEVITEQNFEEKYYGNTVTITNQNHQKSSEFKKQFSLEIKKELEIFLKDFSSEVYISLVNQKHEKYLDINLLYKTKEGDKTDTYKFSNGFQKSIENYDTIQILVKNIGNTRTEFELSVKNLVQVQMVSNDEESDHSSMIFFVIVIIILIVVFLALMAYGIYKKRNKDVYRSQYESKSNRRFESFKPEQNLSQNQRLNQRNSEIQENNIRNNDVDVESSDSSTSKESDEEDDYELDYKQNELYRI